MSTSIESSLTRHALYKWLPRLRDEEQTAITNYTDVNLYRIINATLRGKGIGEKPPANIIDMIKNIDSGLRKFRYPRGFTVYRNVSEEEYIFIKNNGIISSFADFKSTSLMENIALDFSQDETEHIVLVQLPIFVNGAYIAPLSVFKGEKEFLLNKGSKYQILNKLYDKEKN